MPAKIQVTSRKVILAVVGVVTAIVTVLRSTFGLSIDPTAMIGGLGLIALYIAFEAKADITRIGAQPDKWADPKFWITVLMAALTPIVSEFGWDIPIETIQAIVALVITALFSIFKKKNTA